MSGYGFADRSAVCSGRLGSRYEGVTLIDAPMKIDGEPFLAIISSIIPVQP